MGNSELKDRSEASDCEARDSDNAGASHNDNENNGYSSDTQSFEPTIDMLMQENFDYEYDRSSEGSGSQVSNIDEQDEWERLIEEGGYPIDELRAKYGYMNNHDISEKEQPDHVRGSHRSGILFQSYNEGSSGSEIDAFAKKPVRIGPEYQIEVPDDQPDSKYSPNQILEKLTWDPNICSADDMERISNFFNQNYPAIPFDDEEIYKLIMRHRGNYDEIIEDEDSIRHILKKQETPLVDFSIEECLLFKDALLTCGKKFSDIKNKFYPKRTVKDLIHFYYVWKKTPLYEDFLPELESRKRKQAAETMLSSTKEDGLNETANDKADEQHAILSNSGLPPDPKIPKLN